MRTRRRHAKKRHPQAREAARHRGRALQPGPGHGGRAKMPYLLDVIYLVALVAASPWLLWKAISTGKYREGLAARLLGRVPVRSGARTCVWLHAVSMGEVNLLAPLIEELARRRPDWECVVSTTTRTGYALARRKYAHLTVFYSPLDFSWAVRAAMRRIQPDLLVLAELELWPNLIAAARRHG